MIGGETESGEEATDPAEKGAAKREPKAPCQRSSGAEKSRVCGGSSSSASRPGDSETSRVFWEIRENPQSGD